MNYILAYGLLGMLPSGRELYSSWLFISYFLLLLKRCSLGSEIIELTEFLVELRLELLTVEKIGIVLLTGLFS